VTNHVFTLGTMQWEEHFTSEVFLSQTWHLTIYLTSIFQNYQGLQSQGSLGEYPSAEKSKVTWWLNVMWMWFLEWDSRKDRDVRWKLSPNKVGALGKTNVLAP
jgi:hypothetical protein